MNDALTKFAEVIQNLNSKALMDALEKTGMSFDEFMDVLDGIVEDK